MEDVNKRWTEYLKELVNIVDNSVANISAVGNGMVPVCQMCNVDIEYDEIIELLGERKWVDNLIQMILQLDI